jgi:hypothetical protein
MHEFCIFFHLPLGGFLVLFPLKLSELAIFSLAGIIHYAANRYILPVWKNFFETKEMKNILLELIQMVKYTVIHSLQKEGLFRCE